MAQLASPPHSQTIRIILPPKKDRDEKIKKMIFNDLRETETVRDRERKRQRTESKRERERQTDRKRTKKLEYHYNLFSKIYCKEYNH